MLLNKIRSHSEFTSLSPGGGCGSHDLISKGNLASSCCPLIPLVSMVMFCSAGCCSSGRQPAASVSSWFSCGGEELKAWPQQAWPVHIPGPRPYFQPPAVLRKSIFFYVCYSFLTHQCEKIRSSALRGERRPFPYMKKPSSLLSNIAKTCVECFSTSLWQFIPTLVPTSLPQTKGMPQASQRKWQIVEKQKSKTYSYFTYKYENNWKETQHISSLFFSSFSSPLKKTKGRGEETGESPGAGKLLNQCEQESKSSTAL